MEEKDLQNLSLRVSNLLRKLSWPCDFVSKDVLRTYFVGEFGRNEVWITVGLEQISLTIDPVVQRPVPVWRSSVVRLIDHLRKDIKMVRLGISQSGDLFVQVSLPSNLLDQRRFHFVLLNLCRVAEQLQVPILQANAYDNLAASITAYKER